MYKVSGEALNKALGYLQGRPYSEVHLVISAILTAEPLVQEEAPTDEPKEETEE